MWGLSQIFPNEIFGLGSTLFLGTHRPMLGALTDFGFWWFCKCLIFSGTVLDNYLGVLFYDLKMDFRLFKCLTFKGTYIRQQQ